MKKLITLSLSMLLFTLVAKPQTMGGPDAFGYTWRTSFDPQGPVFNWIDLDNLAEVTDVTPLLGDDNLTPYPYLLSVPFHYYWYDPNYFWVGSNGYISFSNGSGIASPFPSIPTSTGQNNYISAMGCDLLFKVNNQPIPGAKCKLWQSPNFDTLIVMWKDVPFWDPNPPGYTGSNTFEMILATADSSITFQYLNQNGYYTQSFQFMTSGIENISGGVGLQYQYDVYPTPGLAVKYYYPQTTSFSINDASTNYTGNAGTKGIFLSKGGTPYTSQAEVKNSGNQPLGPFNVYSRIVNIANSIQVRDTVPTSALAPGQTQVVTFPDKWTHQVPGVFRQINITMLAGDATPTNNQKDLEIQVVDTTQSKIELSFDNTFNAAGLSWNGGIGGGAVHFVPPFYPCTIDSVGAWTDDLWGYGYSMLVYKDDGPNNGPQTLLDSTFIYPGTFINSEYNTTPTTYPIRIDSGGFYVAWMMGGVNVTLGEDWTAPFSNQSYEITGPADDPVSWSTYRNGEASDLIIHATISTISVLAGENASPVASIGEFYPNPAIYKTTIGYNLKERGQVKFEVYNLSGQLVGQKSLGNREPGTDVIELNLQNLKAGVYTCKISIGNSEYNKKIVIVR